MTESLVHPIWKIPTAILAVIVGVWLCYAGTKHALASYYLASPSFEDWGRAAGIEPDNPETWYRLGRFRQLDFVNSDLSLSLSYYQRAIQINPNSPYYKMDFASALETVGKIGEADAEFRGAQEAYPISAEVAWKYGNYLIRQNRLPEAYQQIHQAVTVDPKLIPFAVSRVWHGNPDTHVLFDHVLPATAESYNDALTFFIQEENPTAAREAWNRLVAVDRHTDWKRVFPLIDLLVAKQQFDDARSVWRQAIDLTNETAVGYSANSLVYDGGFEQDIAGGGFGWRQIQAEGSQFDYDVDQRHSGARSVRLTFDGSKNLSYGELSQYILVTPGKRYLFTGYLRTDQLSTESGMRFEILDPKNPKDLDVLTQNQIGSVPWTLEQAEFTAGPQTQEILIRVARKPSERLDNQLRGTVWVDDVALVPIEAK